MSFVEVSAQPPSRLAAAVRAALMDALAERSAIDPRILDIMGMSGRKYRRFINNLIRRLGQARYLEVGSWAGSTLCSAINGNVVNATAIDNWSQFGGPREQFMANVQAFRTGSANVHVIEGDFRQVDWTAIGRYDVYLFDGPHEEQDQYDGLMLALPAMDDEFVFICDDWNWDAVRAGTHRALWTSRLEPVYATEIRTSLDNSQPALTGQNSDWHNGYFISVLRRGA